jgi:hypothetical protein
LEIAEARKLGADVVFLSTEPYPFRVRDVVRLRGEWGEAPACLRADGRLFSWYGTAVVQALEAMDQWLRGKEQGLVVPFA